MNKGKLFLIPTPIGVGEPYDVLPQGNQAVIRGLDYFVVEELRTARRFLSRAGIGKPIDSLTFVELNEHTLPGEIEAMLEPLLKGRDAGLLSEAGVPAVADPGAGLVALAHRHRIEVRPLVGPSSLLLALMGSGMNGQSFAFNGYLPIKQPDRAKAIRSFETRALREDQAQLFIEAPYRNDKFFRDLINTCSDQTRLCVAVDLLEPTQRITTRPIAQWKRETPPEINKHPAVFIIGR